MKLPLLKVEDTEVVVGWSEVRMQFKGLLQKAFSVGGVAFGNRCGVPRQTFGMGDGKSMSLRCRSSWMACAEDADRRQADQGGHTQGANAADRRHARGLQESNARGSR